jgi:hypothetical protein
MTSLRSLYNTDPAFGAYSKTATSTFTIPVLGASDTQELDNVTWISVGQPVFISDGSNWATLEVTAIDTATNTVTLKNTWGEVSGATIAIGGKVSPGGRVGNQGIQGEPGLDGSNGVDGIDGIDGKSAYEIAVEQGFIGNVNEWLTHITGSDGADGAAGADGNDGLSAYELAVNAGFVGSEAQWLASLVGPQGPQGVAGSDGADGSNGDSAYDVAVDNGFIGTEQQWIDSLRGPKGDKGDPGVDGATGASGLTAYEVAWNAGFTGTEAEWLESLNGLTAYEVAVQEGFAGTEQQWLDSLNGYGVALQNGFVGTQQEWLDSLIGPPGNLEVYSSLILPNNSRINGVEHFYQATKPTVRGDGSALVIGDRWWKTDDGTEWFWNGTYWLGDINYVTLPRYSTSTSSSTSVSFHPQNDQVPIPGRKVLIESVVCYMSTASQDNSNNYTVEIGIYDSAAITMYVVLDTFNSFFDTILHTTSSTRRTYESTINTFVDLVTPAPLGEANSLLGTRFALANGTAQTHTMSVSLRTRTVYL